MRKYRRPLMAMLFGAAVAASGCQTYFGGMTLPSPHYLKHPPQYFTPDPPFPLQRELDSMTDPDAAARRANVTGAIPVPGAGAPADAVAAPGR